MFSIHRISESVKLTRSIARTASQTMLLIYLRAFHTLCALTKAHALCLDLREEAGKSIGALSPFTFISHLFLILSFLLPPSLPQLLFNQPAVYEMHYRSVNGLSWSVKTKSNCWPSTQHMCRY